VCAASCADVYNRKGIQKRLLKNGRFSGLLRNTLKRSEEDELQGLAYDELPVLRIFQESEKEKGKAPKRKEVGALNIKGAAGVKNLPQEYDGSAFDHKAGAD